MMQSRWVWGLGGATVAAAWLMAGCGADNSTGPQGDKPRTVAERPLSVKVASLKRGAVDRRLGFVGEIVAEETVEVAAKLSGRIRSIKVRMGDTVKKGALLVEIEDRQLRAELQEARASLTVARASIRRAEEQERNAASEVARKSKLHEKDLVTAQEMDNLRSRQATEAAALDVARAEATRSEARISLLSTELKDSRIRAPFTGKVSARYLDPGAVVNPGTAILRLIDVDPIIARFKVPERYLGAIMVKSEGGEAFEVTVRLDALPEKRFPGRVARISPALDKATRSALVEAELLEKSGPVSPGMYCRVELDLGRLENALLVPTEALLEDPGGSGSANGASGPVEGRLFVVKSGRAHEQKVSLGARSDGHLEVLAGLEPDARVVVEGQRLLKEGAKVTVIGEGAPAKPAGDAGNGK